MGRLRYHQVTGLIGSHIGSVAGEVNMGKRLSIAALFVLSLFVSSLAQQQGPPAGATSAKALPPSVWSRNPTGTR